MRWEMIYSIRNYGEKDPTCAPVLPLGGRLGRAEQFIDIMSTVQYFSFTYTA